MRKHLYLTGLSLVLLALLSSCVPAVYSRPYPIAPVSLPRDDAAHDAPIEWWYYTGHLEATSGEPFGFELTFFKMYTPPHYTVLGFIPAFWFVDKGFVGHAAVSYAPQEQFVSAQQMSFGSGKQGASQERYEVFVESWRAELAEDGISHLIYADDEAFNFELKLTPTKPASLHGEPPGIQSMGPGGTSYYVSYTRMEASGTLTFCPDDQTCTEHTVHGQAWHDHQWGDFSLEGYAGWDWFSLQFDSGSELMLYLIRMPGDVYVVQGGSWVTPEGVTIPLTDGFTVSETGLTWESPTTGAIYPMEWQVQVPQQDLDITITPTMLQQEMDTRRTTGIVYWEGAVTVRGTHEGVGFVELTNYDLYPYGQTQQGDPLKPLRGPQP